MKIPVGYYFTVNSGKFFFPSDKECADIAANVNQRMSMQKVKSIHVLNFISLAISISRTRSNEVCVNVCCLPVCVFVYLCSLCEIDLSGVNDYCNMKSLSRVQRKTKDFHNNFELNE